MRIVVDTNIVFSAVLNTNSKIAKIILKPNSGLNLYATDTLRNELFEHKSKLKKLAGYTEDEYLNLTSLVISRIRFINAGLIPVKIFRKAELLLHEIDIDDTEFVALAEHIRGVLWTGDREMTNRLIRSGWRKLISTNELYHKLFNRRK
jgi:predicted nucleic acid-binding protein